LPQAKDAGFALIRFRPHGHALHTSRAKLKEGLYVSDVLA
jgi:hypothetical protein